MSWGVAERLLIRRPGAHDGALATPPAEFARHLRAGGSADRTIAIYGQAIRFFSEWLEAQRREPALSELNRAAIREWLAQLTDTHQPATVALRYRGLFRFCGWLVDEDELLEHPMKTLSPPQNSKPVPVLTDDELVALMKACGKEFRDRRDEAMIRLLLDKGNKVRSRLLRRPHRTRS